MPAPGPDSPGPDSPGPVRRLVVEADGGSRGNPGPAGYGALVRDAESGEVLAEEWEFLGVRTNNQAEYQGLIAGLRAAHAIDPAAVVTVRMDSRLVVEQMSGRWRIWNETLRALAAEARAVHPPEAVGYEWVPRKRNKHADRLANRAMDAGAKRGRKSPRAAGAASEPAPRVVVTTFLLLRHGATAVTAEKRFSGVGDPPLAAEGRRQAERAAEAVATAYAVPDVVISSPLARCRATAQLTADRIGGLPVLIEPDLRETDFGAWEGLTFAEAAREHPAEMAAWLNDPDAAPPGGESFTEVTERVAAARDRILAAHAGRTVLIVSHVTPIKTLARLALGAGPEALYRMELDAASLTVLRYYSDGPVSLRVLNDTAHLR